MNQVKCSNNNLHSLEKCKEIILKFILFTQTSSMKLSSHDKFCLFKTYFILHGYIADIFFRDFFYYNFFWAYFYLWYSLCCEFIYAVALVTTTKHIRNNYIGKTVLNCLNLNKTANRSKTFIAIAINTGSMFLVKW